MNNEEKRLAHEREYFSSDPQDPHKDGYSISLVSVIPSLLWQNGEWRQENPWECLGQPAWSMQQ